MDNSNPEEVVEHFRKKYTTLRYYVDYSSIFNNKPYDIALIKERVLRGGGHNVRTSLLHGWSNQPSVVTFSANRVELSQITDGLNEALNTQWIIIREKNW